MEITTTFQLNDKEWGLIHTYEKEILDRLNMVGSADGLSRALDYDLNVLRNSMCLFFMKCCKDDRTFTDLSEFVNTVGVGKLVWKMIHVMYYQEPDNIEGQDDQFDQLDGLVETIDYWAPSYASELAIMRALYHDYFSPIHLDLLNEQSDEEVPENVYPFRMEYLNFDMWNDDMWDWILKGWSKYCTENENPNNRPPVTLYTNTIFLKVLMADPKIIDVIIHLNEAGVLTDAFTVSGAPYFNMGKRSYVYVRDLGRDTETDFRRFDASTVVTAYLQANQDIINTILRSEIEKYGFGLEIGGICSDEEDAAYDFCCYKIKNYSHNYSLNIVDESLEESECATSSAEFGKTLSDWMRSTTIYDDQYAGVVMNFIRNAYYYMWELLYAAFRDGDPDQPINKIYLHEIGERAPENVIDEVKQLVAMNTLETHEDTAPDSEPIKKTDSELVVDIGTLSIETDESSENKRDIDDAPDQWDEFVTNLKSHSVHAHRIGAAIDIKNQRLKDDEVICGFPVYALFLDYTIHSENMIDWILTVAKRINSGEYNTSTIYLAASDIHTHENNGLFCAEMYRDIPFYLARYMGLVIPNSFMSDRSYAVRDMVIDEMLRDNGIVYKKPTDQDEDKYPIGHIYHLPNSAIYTGYYYEGLRIAFSLMSIDYRDQIPSVMADASKISITTGTVDMLACIFKLVGKRDNGPELLDTAIGYAAGLYERWLTRYFYDHFKVNAKLEELGFSYSTIRPLLDIYINPEVWRDRGQDVEISLPPYVRVSHSVDKYDNLI